MDALRRLGRRLSSVNSRTVKLGALAALVVYALVMLWPYLAATLVRDAAITAWMNLATAPIHGRVMARLPMLGSQVGPDGIILELINEQIDPGLVPRADAALDAARSRTRAAKAYLEGVQEIDRDRRDLMKLYAGQYRAQLDAEIVQREARVAALKLKATLAAQVAERMRNITDSGYRSKDYRDDGAIRLAEAEADLTAERMALDQVKRRRAASDEGVFILPDGTSPIWAYDQRQDAKTEIKKARLALEQAEAAEDEAEQALMATRENYKVQSRAGVKAPPGSTIRSLIIGEGSFVGPGGPVARWIDCTEIMVDAPVSDAALPLIPMGSKAEVIIEGENRWRTATVTNIRGAAETITVADLAAVAKGRGQGDGQVLLMLHAERSEFASCPVGQAAYVHFPSAGIVAVLLARLGIRR